MVHHDISVYNLAFRREESGKLIGVLIDFELAILTLDDIQPNRKPVGTPPFMAHMHMYKPKAAYRLCHELESYLYCAVWHGLGYDACKEFPRAPGHEEDILHQWRTGSWADRASAKYLFLTWQIQYDIIRHIPDKEFAKKCRCMVERFRIALLRESLDQKFAEYFPDLYKRINVPDPKVTYATMLRALGQEPEDCSDICCLQDA